MAYRVMVYTAVWPPNLISLRPLGSLRSAWSRSSLCRAQQFILNEFDKFDKFDEGVVVATCSIQPSTSEIAMREFVRTGSTASTASSPNMSPSARAPDPFFRRSSRSAPTAAAGRAAGSWKGAALNGADPRRDPSPRRYPSAIRSCAITM